MLHTPFVQARHAGGKQKPSLISLRFSDTTTEDGAALAMATYWSTPSAPSSPTHYVVDAGGAYQCVPDLRVAGTYRPLEKSISITMCVEPKLDVVDWAMPGSIDVLVNAAKLVGRLAHDHKIPLRYLDPVAFQRWTDWRSKRRGGLYLEFQGAWPYQLFQNRAHEERNLM